MSSISVIIPTFNRRNTIKRAVDSVLSQTRAADEIIVVDDGSTDGTSDMLRQHYTQVILLIQDNKGVSSARNTGIERATSKWIALLDSDDEWHPDKLVKQMKHLHDNPEHLLVHTDEIWIRNGVRVNQMKKHKKYGGHIFQHCLPLCAISPSSVLIHSSIFETVGLFDESLPVCEDYDMWLRICSRYPVLFVDEALITKYGGHEDQLSRKLWGMDRFRIRAIEKILSDGVLSDQDRESAIATMKTKIDIYLNGAIKHGNTESVTEMNSLLSRYDLKQVALNI